MIAKFTKGPWRIESRVAGDFVFASEEQLNAGFNICKVSGPESICNASLIACAPEMCEMLDSLLQNSSFNANFPEEAERIESLLAKARGEV